MIELDKDASAYKAGGEYEVPVTKQWDDVRADWVEDRKESGTTKFIGRFYRPTRHSNWDPDDVRKLQKFQDKNRSSSSKPRPSAASWRNYSRTSLRRDQHRPGKSTHWCEGRRRSSRSCPTCKAGSNRSDHGPRPRRRVKRQANRSSSRPRNRHDPNTRT